jgi:hypothetical protein
MPCKTFKKELYNVFRVGLNVGLGSLTSHP